MTADLAIDDLAIKSRGQFSVGAETTGASAARATAFPAGCATVPAPAGRSKHAQALAAPRGWTMQTIPASRFPLATYLPPAITPAAQITLYLEGDGMARTGPARTCADPTPIDPLALRLALAQPAGAAAYPGRPCQSVFAADTCEESL